MTTHDSWLTLLALTALFCAEVCLAQSPTAGQQDTAGAAPPAESGAPQPPTFKQEELDQLAAIQVCRAIVDAQREYTQLDPDGDGVHEYAQKFLSDAGKKNGLYWKTDGNEPLSPLGPLVATASEEGYTSVRTETGEPQAYHSYYYHMLTSQGSHAAGGKRNYIVKGKMTGGFAVVAWPAEYGNSGMMTFLVSHNDVVFQRDLGRRTDRTARALIAFDPGEGWDIVE